MTYSPSPDAAPQWLRDTAAATQALAGGTATETANTPSVQTSTTALDSNTSRTGWQIQNVGTNPLFVLLGSGVSTSVFHMVLKGGSASNDGLGDSFAQLSGPIYTGEVTIAGTSPSYVVLEMS